MPVVKLTLQYDGTEFVGWQRQAAGRSIQGALEEALGQLEGRAVAAVGAGRTDAGVHALGQVASATITRAIGPDALLKALNSMQPASVRVVAVEPVGSDFNARFSARSKTYQYRIRTGAVASPFDRHYAWHVRQPLDVAAMTQACERLVGHHDFSAFRSTGSDVVSTRRTILEARLSEPGTVNAPPQTAPCTVDFRWHLENEGWLLFEIRGDGFLRHMVRIVVGTLVEVGHGRRTPESVAAALESGRRADAGMTAPAHGLCLVRVEY